MCRQKVKNRMSSSAWDNPKPITVKEFIEVLEKLDPDLPVYTDNDERVIPVTEVSEGFKFQDDVSIHSPYYQSREEGLKSIDPEKFEQGQFYKILVVC